VDYVTCPNFGPEFPEFGRQLPEFDWNAGCGWLSAFGSTGLTGFDDLTSLSPRLCSTFGGGFGTSRQTESGPRGSDQRRAATLQGRFRHTTLHFGLKFLFKRKPAQSIALFITCFI
jgi:hypothetical protein